MPPRDNRQSPPSAHVELLREVLRAPVHQHDGRSWGNPERSILESYLGRFYEGLAVVAPDGRIRLFSSGLEHITGYRASELGDITELIACLAPDSALGEQQLGLFLQGQAHSESEEQLIEIVSKSGEHRWLRGRLYRAAEDTIVHVLDITAIHKLRGATPHNTEHYQILLDNLEMGIYCLSDPAKGKLSYANRTARRIVGLPADADAASITSFMLYERPEDRVQLLQALMADGFAKSRTVRLETRLLHLQTRQPVPVRLTMTASYDEHGVMSRIDGVIEDLSEQVAFEAQRQEQELLVSTLFYDVTAGIVIGTISGHILAANPAFCEMVGYSEEDLMGRAVDLITHPEDQGLALREIGRAIAEGRKIFSYIKRYIHKDGHSVRVRCTMAGVADAQGKPAAGVAIVEPLPDEER
jgi:PAS domain S-box-containing protein